MKWSIFIILSFIILSCNKQNLISSDNINYKKARACRDSNVTDSAFYYYNIAKNDYLKINDSLGVAKSLANMAIIQTKKGDYYGGIETSLEANRFLKKEKDSIVRSTLAGNYNNMAIASHFLKNYENALSFQFKALKYSNDNVNKLTYYNNIADVLITVGDFKSAKKYLEIAIHNKESNNYSRALNNLAKAKYLEDKNYNPLPELYKALKIRIKNNDYEGQNSSFETLSEYFLKRDKTLSLAFAKKMLESANNAKSTTDQILALRKIIELDPKNYLVNFQKLTLISSNLQITRNKAKNQFAVVRYDVEQKNAQNQVLKIQSFKQNVGIASLIIVLITGYFWNEKRKKNIRNEKEKEKKLEVKNTELKYSKKVHDVVANGLYHMMTDIQNNPNVDKVHILNNIEKMYEESRDISHENTIEIDFYKRFENMIASYNTADQKVLPVGYNENIWDDFSYNTRLELYYIIRELLVNMKKHSQAKLVVLKFEKDKNFSNIKYTDNGVGIDDWENKKGTGIFNMENRIEIIGGDINFEKNPKGGLIIQIRIPKK